MRDRRSTDREIVALALPAMAALAADPLLGLVDTALVGRLGAVPLAALGINVAVFNAAFLVFNFLTYGTTAEVARLRGAGRPDDAARYALQALWLAVGLGVVVTAALILAAEPIVGAMGAAGPVTDPALAYLRVRALAAAPVLVVAVGHGAFRGLKDTRTPLGVAVGANAVNAAASYLLIYPGGLGVVGAAYGTLLAQTGAAVAFLVLARRRGRFPLPGLRVDLVAMRAIGRISRDLFLRTGSLLTALLVSTAAATRMGVEVVAAHQIARELWTMLALVLDGFAVAAQAMVGTALGAGRHERARADARRLVGWGLATGTVAGAGYLALAVPLPRLFTGDPAILAEVAAVWLVVAALQPVGGVVFVLDGVFMGAGDFRFLLWSTAAAALGALVPVCLAALTFGWGLPGIWAGMAALMVVRLAATSARLAGGRWATSRG
ncbi:MAG TPA: MATE family efflux transporter [Egibacteraceae bacterium]|nr:MATE family efflux transporter [Egibacteraceae bacterium]